jgi:hypothetical protein
LRPHEGRLSFSLALAIRFARQDADFEQPVGDIGL